MKFQNLSLLFALTVAVLLDGCGSNANGPERIDVKGTVTFDGKPVPQGRIIFEPDSKAGNDGPQGYAEIENGTYDTAATGKGPVPGAQIVTITGYDGNVVPPSDDDEGSPLGAPLFDAWRTKHEVPKSSPTESNFTVDPETGLKQNKQKQQATGP